MMPHAHQERAAVIPKGLNGKSPVLFDISHVLEVGSFIHALTQGIPEAVPEPNGKKTEQNHRSGNIGGPVRSSIRR
jgi:hypothetical protein